MGPTPAILQKSWVKNMDDLMEQVNRILSDPESMEQIKNLASSMGIANQSENEPPSAISIPNEISEALQHVRQKEEKQQALVNALLPYLRPGHRKKLEQAVRIARLSQLAGSAWRTTAGNISQKEATTDV